MKNRESEEMYLETIFLLKRKKPSVRSVDVVEELGYAKSSVSRAVNLLAKKNYVSIDPASGEIALTEIGAQRAGSIYERHRILTEALIKMGAEKPLAESNACRIEHVITAELFDIVKKFVEEKE